MKLKIVSDGTPIGTFLVNEATGEKVENVITKIVWEADAKALLNKITIDMIDVPVDIVSKADVDLFEYKENDDHTDWVPVHTKSFEKEIRVEARERGNGVIHHAVIFDNETNKAVGAIQKITWESTPEECKAKITKIMFDRKDWI
jgi:hypothetical protein